MWASVRSGSVARAERVHKLMAARVRTLSAAGQEAVLVASALSRPTFATVADALGANRDPLTALVEVEEAGVLVSEGERIRFSHPLLASAVYGSASTQRRRQLHRRLADVATDPEERARHLAQSATGLTRQSPPSRGGSGARGATGCAGRCGGAL